MSEARSGLLRRLWTRGSFQIYAACRRSAMAHGTLPGGSGRRPSSPTPRMSRNPRIGRDSECEDRGWRSDGSMLPIHDSLTRFRTSADLFEAGMTRRQITAAVAAGSIVRVRGDVYVDAAVAAPVLSAARMGGRLHCVSALALSKVFVEERPGTHVHFWRNGVSRAASNDVTRHWGDLMRSPHPRSLVVEPIDALRQAILCQKPRAAIATIDSALHLGLVRADELDEVFGALPERTRRLRTHIDGRAESGTETLVRLIARALGGQVEIQVFIKGVGRVDIVVDGWLVIECDSREFHAGWNAQLEDRRRDLALAALGYTTIRPTAEDILYRPEVVVAAIAGLLRSASSGRGVRA